MEYIEDLSVALQQQAREVVLSSPPLALLGALAGSVLLILLVGVLIGRCIAPAAASVTSTPVRAARRAAPDVGGQAQSSGGNGAAVQRREEYREVAVRATEELLSDALHPDDSWQSLGTSQGVQLSGKEDGAVMCMRGEGVIAAAPEAVADFLASEERRKEWDTLCEAQSEVERLDEHTRIVHNMFRGVWPVQGRDMVFVSSTEVSEIDGVRTMVSSTCSVEHPDVPVKSNYVRGILSGGGFVVQEVDGGCRVVFVARVDLKGSIPGPLRKMLARKQPLCIARIRKCVEVATDAGETSMKQAVSASHLGEPDFGLLTQSEVLDIARRVCRAVKVPVVVDGDTGFGGTLNVMHMVKQLIAMGARGVLLEDQQWPKRCGHMEGKSVVPMEEHVRKIRAAVEARGNEDAFMITARTDSRIISLDEAIRRGRAYKEAGADFIFIEAPQSVEEIERIAREVPGPLVINNIEGGKTPILPLETLHKLGFMSVGFVLTGLFAAAHALDKTYRHLLEHGTSDGLSYMGFDEFTDMIGLKERMATDARFRD